MVLAAVIPAVGLAQTSGYPITEPNYIAPITSRELDKTKPSVTLAGEVNIANGTANYTLPINVPVGIQGVQPNLAITYNSNGGNGQLGLGWALAGTSAFSRGGSSYFVDDQVAPVTLTDDDNLYLDGQRLLPYDGKSGFGATAEYRTLTKSYQKIEFIDSDVIKVTQKDGITRYYGGANARLRLTNPSTQTNETYMWFLFKVEDRNENYMTYDYVIDANNEARLNKINYTANDAAGISPKTEVQFGYTMRTDARSGYLLGNELHNSLLLHTITVMHNNTQYSKYTLNYMFDQTPKLGNDFSKLVEIQYQAQTKELNSVVVRWPGLASAEFALGTYQGHTSNIDKYSSELVGDFNGDGVSDLLILKHRKEQDGFCSGDSIFFHKFKVELKLKSTSHASSSSFNPQPDWQTSEFRSEWWQKACSREAWARIYTGDFNGDGLLDFALSRSWIGGSKPTNRYNQFELDFYLNDPLSPGLNFTKVYKVIINDKLDEPQDILVADFDGDGLTDVIDFKDFSGTTAQGQPSAGWYQVNLDAQHGWRTDIAVWSLSKNKPEYIETVDLDSDGDLDLIVKTGSQSHVYMNTSGGFQFKFTTSHIKSTLNIFPVNFNGDHLIDFLVYEKNAIPEWKYLLNTDENLIPSSGFISGSDIQDFSLSNLQLPNGQGKDQDFLLNSSNSWPLFFDIDQDGRTDIGFLTAQNSSGFILEIRYNKITSWESSSYLLPASAVDLANHSFRNLHLVDFSGEGFFTLFYDYNVNITGTTPIQNWGITMHPDKYNTRVSSILDGANTLTTFTYKPLTDNSIYARGNTEVYPNPVITAPLYVVSQVQQELFDGTAITNINYQYEGARVNSLGLGLLGFEKIWTTDQIQGRQSISTFALTATQTQYKTQPMLPQKTEVYSIVTNTLLASTEYTYYGAVVQTASGITPWQYNPQVFEEKSKDFVHGTSAKTSYIYDNFGNISSTLSHTYNNTGFTAPYVSRTEEVASYNLQNNLWYLKSMPIEVTSTVTRYGQPPATKTTNFTYDDQQPNPKGNLTQKIDYPGEEVEVVTDYSYFTSTGNLKDETVTPFNMADRTQSYTYTADGRFVESETNPMGWTVTYEYDDLLGVRTKQTDFNNLVTEWEYDEFGRVTKEMAPDGTETNTSYAFFTGQNPQYLFTIVSTGTAMPPAEAYADGLGRTRLKRTKNRDNAWVAVRTDYDSRGREYRTSQPYYPGTTPLWNTITFDDNNRPLTVTAAAGKSVNYAYNARTTTVTNPYTNQSSSKTVDADGLTVTATDAGGSITYTYNSFGQPISVTGPSGTPITSTFDAYGRQTQLNDPAAGPMSYAYDALGQLIEQTDNAGNTYEMTYDDLGRITQKIGPEGTYTYTYDAGFLGKQESQSAPNGITHTTHYDAPGRPETYTEEIDGVPYTMHYTYNTDGQLESMTYPNNFGVNYIYDNNGYTTGMTRTDNNEQIWNFGAENRFGQLTEYTLGNNLNMELQYDAISGLPTSVDNGQNWGMSYDFDVHTGNLNSRAHLYNGLSEDFEYDNLDRLISYNTETNPLSVTYANTGSITFKGDAGRYTNHQPTGRTTSVDHESSASGFEISDVTQNITYTAFNSVETIMEGDYDAFFTYGPDQQRSKMLINHQGGTYIERMYMAGGQYERDRLPDGSWRNLTYISTPAGLSAVFIQNEDTQEEEFYFIHTDYQGSIMALTDYNGQLVEEYSYDPWGNRRDPNTWQTIYTNTTLPFRLRRSRGRYSLPWLHLPRTPRLLCPH